MRRRWIVSSLSTDGRRHQAADGERARASPIGQRSEEAACLSSCAISSADTVVAVTHLFPPVWDEDGAQTCRFPWVEDRCSVGRRERCR